MKNRMTKEQAQNNILMYVNKAITDISYEVKKRNQEIEKKTQEINEAPCAVCKKSKFVMKYRDVRGEIEGRTSGSFYLFGGSISGYIDGKISTMPVLSCRECENERQIKIPTLWTNELLFAYMCPYASEYSNRVFGIYNKWLQQYGLEVALILDKEIYAKQLLNYNVPKVTDEEFAKAGLKRKFPQYEIGGKRTYSNIGFPAGVWILMFGAVVLVSLILFTLLNF